MKGYIEREEKDRWKGSTEREERSFNEGERVMLRSRKREREWDAKKRKGNKARGKERLKRKRKGRKGEGKGRRERKGKG